MQLEIKCFYCDAAIIKRSKEHIIQNALGGSYTSTNICCEECNKYLGKCIDAPFTKIFKPFISRIVNLSKSNNKNSKSFYSGKTIYQDKMYDVDIINNKIISYPQLREQFPRNDISKLNLKVHSYSFELKNDDFQNGLKKIAFNFALDKGVPIHLLKENLHIEKLDGKITNVSFSCATIPFFPLNPIDEYIELETNLELYHHLILFNQDNILWCYIDLFNTFQFYVCLSDKWNSETDLFEFYLQLVTKADRTVPEFSIRKYKDIQIDAAQYNIKPCTSLNGLRKYKSQRERVLATKPLEQDSYSIIESKALQYVNSIQRKHINSNETPSLEELYCIQSYFDVMDKFMMDKFRITFQKNFKWHSYPELIINLVKKNTDLSQYTYSKFYRLENFLNRNDNNEI